MAKYLKTYPCKCGNLSLYKDKCSDCRDIENARRLEKEKKAINNRP